MSTSTSTLRDLLSSLTGYARRAGWSDAEWARRSGLPKETLCRLRSRTSCDFATLAALARAVGSRVEVPPPDRLWPDVIDRAFESRLRDLVATGSTRAADWLPLGPSFFMSGVAVMLASVRGFDRRRYLELAEALHPGSTEPGVFSRWLAETPLGPSRFLPPLLAMTRRAA